MLLSSPFSTEFPSLQSDPICEHLKYLIGTLVIIDRTFYLDTRFVVSHCTETYLEQFEVLDIDDEDVVGK